MVFLESWPLGKWNYCGVYACDCENSSRHFVYQGLSFFESLLTLYLNLARLCAIHVSFPRIWRRLTTHDLQKCWASLWTLSSASQATRRQQYTSSPSVRPLCRPRVFFEWDISPPSSPLSLVCSSMEYWSIVIVVGRYGPLKGNGPSLIAKTVMASNITRHSAIRLSPESNQEYRLSSTY